MSIRDSSSSQTAKSRVSQNNKLENDQGKQWLTICRVEEKLGQQIQHSAETMKIHFLQCQVSRLKSKPEKIVSYKLQRQEWIG